MSWMYETSNDDYGAAKYGKTDRSSKKVPGAGPPVEEVNLNRKERSVDEVKEYSTLWKQGFEDQHPMYKTSANNIGSKPPNPATMHQVTYPLQASFTQTFTERYRNNGLNTHIDSEQYEG